MYESAQPLFLVVGDAQLTLQHEEKPPHEYVDPQIFTYGELLH